MLASCGLHGVLEVVAGMVDQCGSKSNAKRQGERDKSDHNPKVATVTTKCRKVAKGGKKW